MKSLRRRDLADCNCRVETERSISKPDVESALYVGAIATAIVYLLPYIDVVLFGFPIPPYLVGALLAVWYAVKKRSQVLSYGNGAKLAFLSTFLGGIGSAIVFDIIWQFFDYQLWQKQNSDLVIAIFSVVVSSATLDKIGRASCRERV